MNYIYHYDFMLEQHKKLKEEFSPATFNNILCASYDAIYYILNEPRIESARYFDQKLENKFGVSRNTIFSWFKYRNTITNLLSKNMIIKIADYCVEFTTEAFKNKGK